MLNRYQRNALEVGLRQLEQSIRRLAHLSREPPRDGLLTRVRPLPEGCRIRLEALTSEMLQEVELVVRQFGLRPEEQWLERLVAGEMAVAWANLHDLMSKKLVRYGEVNPGLGRRLDPHIQRLMRLTRAAGRLPLGKADKETE